MIEIEDRLTAFEMREGAGAKVYRVFPPLPHRRHFDPFVLLDEFAVEKPAGFPMHPHQGFEAVTFMLSGGFRHQDNLGNEGEIGAGGAQRFSAGPGFEHSEMPASDGVNHGLQLWIRMEKRLHQEASDYQQVSAESFPVAEVAPHVRVKTVIGSDSPLLLRTEVIYRVVEVSEAATFSLPVTDGHQGFLYSLGGASEVCGESVQPREVIFWSKGDTLEIDAKEKSLLMIATGRPHGEKVIQHGSFVK